MSEIAHIEEKGTTRAIGYTFLFLIFTTIFSFTFSMFSLDLTLAIGFMKLITFQFLSTWPVFGIPFNIIYIGTILICLLVIWFIVGSTVHITFKMDGAILKKTVSSRLTTINKEYDTNQIEHLALDSTTTVTRHYNTGSSGSTYGGTSISTVHTVSAIYKGVSIKNEIIYRSADVNKVKSIAQRIADATKLEIK